MSLSPKARILAVACLIILTFMFLPSYTPAKRTNHDISLPDPKKWIDSDVDLSSSSLRHGRIVVSLSTFPGRAERLETTLESLELQTKSFDRLYIHMPKSVGRLKGVVGEGVPPILQEYKTRWKGKLVITHPDDFGPSTKLLPTLLLETDPKTIIVVVDDDVRYHPRTIEALVKTLESNTKNFTQTGHPAAYCCEEWSKFIPFPLIRYNTRSPGSICSGYMCAYASEAFVRWHFSDETVKALFDYQVAPDGCRLHDDVWISGTLKTYGNVRPMMVKDRLWSVEDHRKWDSLTIHKVPGTEKKYRNPCLAHFGWFLS